MSVSVDLDKPRELKFDIRATRDLENQLGKPLGLILQDITNFGVNSIVAALWAGLKHEDKSITPNLSEKLFQTYVKDRKSMKSLMTKISAAMEETGLFSTDETEDVEGNAPAVN